MKKWILWLLTLVFMSSAGAQEDFSVRNRELVDTRVCGTISIALPLYSLASMDIDVRYMSKKREQLEAFYVRFVCRTYEDALNDDKFVRYNSDTKLWELSPHMWQRYTDEDDILEAKNRTQVEQLTAQNSQGWFSATQENLSQRDGGSYTQKSLSFCLMRSEKNLALCADTSVSDLYDCKPNSVCKMDELMQVVKEMAESIEFVD